MNRVFQFEHRQERVASLPVFLGRLGRNVLLALALIFPSLLVGMAGFVFIEGKNWVEAYDYAAMILSGMGPFEKADGAWGQIFEGTYALYSGLLVVGVSGLVLAPVFHRVMHSFHVPDSDEDANKPQKKR